MLRLQFCRHNECDSGCDAFTRLCGGCKQLLQLIELLAKEAGSLAKLFGDSDVTRFSRPPPTAVPACHLDDLMVLLCTRRPMMATCSISNWAGPPAFKRSVGADPAFDASREHLFNSLAVKSRWKTSSTFEHPHSRCGGVRPEQVEFFVGQLTVGRQPRRSPSVVQRSQVALRCPPGFARVLSEFV